MDSSQSIVAAVCDAIYANVQVARRRLQVGRTCLHIRRAPEESDIIATWGSLSRRSALKNVGFDDHQNWSNYLARDKLRNRSKSWEVITKRHFHTCVMMFNNGESFNSITTVACRK